jgi:hypothetical protein
MKDGWFLYLWKILGLIIQVRRKCLSSFIFWNSDIGRNDSSSKIKIMGGWEIGGLSFVGYIENCFLIFWNILPYNYST